MTEFELTMISGYQKRNAHRMPTKISGLIDTLAYFGVDRQIEIIEIPVEVPVEVPVYITGATQYVDKEIYVSGEIRISGDVQYIVEPQYVSGETIYVSGETVYVSGETVFVDKEIYVSGEIRISGDVQYIYVTVSGEVQEDPLATTLNNTGTKQDIFYAGRVEKWVDNSNLLDGGAFVNTLAASQGYNGEGIPNYFNQIPFDVRQFTPKNDALLKRMISEYELKKSTDDATMLAIQKWVIFGSIKTYMTSITSDINNQLQNVINNWPSKAFDLVKYENLSLKTLPFLGIPIVQGELKAEFDKRKNKAIRTPVLAYSSDRTAEQKSYHLGRPVLDSYDYWLFPWESLFSGYGDCEDGAILIAALALNAGIPTHKIRVCAGFMGAGSSSQGVAHVWCIYYASDGKWRVVDWCNSESYGPGSGQNINDNPNNYPAQTRTSILNLMYAENDNKYGNVMFSFNSDYSWLGKPY